MGRVATFLPSCFGGWDAEDTCIPGFPGLSGPLRPGSPAIRRGTGQERAATGSVAGIQRIGALSTGGTAVLDRMTKRVGYSVCAAAVSPAPSKLSRRRPTAKAPWPRAS